MYCRDLSAFFLLLVALVAGLGGSGLAFAADEFFRCPDGGVFSQERAAEELRRVQDGYAEVKTIHASFTQESFAAALEVTETSSGEVFFESPGKMRWHYQQPEEQVFVVQGESLMLYQKTENQVVIDDFAAVMISDLPVAFMMGLGELRRDFKVASGCSTKEGVILNLVPLGDAHKDQQLRGFSLLLGADQSFPKGVKVVDVGGNQTVIKLGDMVVNSKLEQSLFQIDFPRGADVVDRRQARSIEAE
jgi:outer membrane lipoprotein carrier protein